MAPLTSRTGCRKRGSRWTASSQGRLPCQVGCQLTVSGVSLHFGFSTGTSRLSTSLAWGYVAASENCPQLATRISGFIHIRRLVVHLRSTSRVHYRILAFVLAQAAKLAEEVGELQAEVLGQAGYQRATKDQCFTAESMSRELADVMICVAILAGSHNIDLGKAVASKIETIDARHQG